MKERVIVFISRGMVSEVYASSENVDVEVIDLDDCCCDEEREQAVAASCDEIRKEVETGKLIRID